MPSASGELFSLSGSTPVGAYGHASGVLTGQGSAAVGFRRGFDLSAQIDIKAALDAEVGSTLAATVQAGVDIKAGVIVQAQIPLDLFTEAGLIARAEFDLAASAYASLTLTLSTAAFEQLVGGRRTDLVGDLLDILLEEFAVSAGVWVRASFAIEVMARGILSVTLFGPAPGFTFMFEAGVAIAYGSGLSFLVNLGIPNPDRLVARIGARLATTMATLIGDGTPAQREAAATAKILIPSLLGSVMSMGRALLSARTGSTATTNAAAALGTTVLQHSLDVVLHAAVDAAFAELRAALQGTTIFADLAAIEDVTAATTAIETMRAAVSTLAGADADDATTWVPAVLEVIAQLDALVALPGMDPTIGTTVAPVIGVVWGAGVLIEGIVARAASNDGSAVSLLDGAPSEDPGPALRQLYGGTVTYRSIAGYLGTELERLLEGIPEIEEVLAVIGKFVGTATGVISTLVDLAGRGPSAVGALVAPLVQAEVTASLHDLVLPALAAAAADDPSAAAFVTGLGQPLTTALTSIIPLVLDDLGDDEARMRAREGLSSVLMTVVGDSVMTIAQVLMDHGAATGPDAASASASDITANGTASATYQQLAGAAQSQNVSPATAADIVGKAGTLTPQLSSAAARPLTGSVGSAIAGGVSDPATATAAASAILTTSGEPNPGGLQAAVGAAGDQAIAFAGKLLQELWDDIVHGLETLGGIVVTAIEQAAQAIYAALEAGIAWAQSSLEELGKKIDGFERAAEQWLSSALAAAAALADMVRASVDRFFDHLIAQVTTYLESHLSPIITWWLVPLIDGVLRGLEEIVDELAKIVDAIAGALSARLHQAATSGQLTTQMFDDHVTAVVYGAPAHDVHVSIGPVPVTVQSGIISGAAMTILTTDPGYGLQRARAVDGVGQYASARANRAQAVVARDSAAVGAAMAGRVAGLRTGRPLTVDIESPSDSGVEPGITTAAIRIGGANRTFVESQASLGMPNRVRIFLNDQEVTVISNQWASDGDDLVWHATLVAVTPTVLAPVAPQAVEHRRTVRSITRDVRGGGPRDLVVTVGTSRRVRSTDPSSGAPSVAVSAAVPRARVPLTAAHGVVQAHALHPEVAAYGTVLAVHPGVNTLAVAVADGDGAQARAQVVFAIGYAGGDRSGVVIASIVPRGPTGEYVALRNGGTTPVALRGWTLRDVARHVLRLPDVEIGPGATIAVHTTTGTSTPTDVFLNRRAQVWNDSGDTAILLDADGALVDTLTYRGA